MKITIVNNTNAGCLTTTMSNLNIKKNFERISKWYQKKILFRDFQVLRNYKDFEMDSPFDQVLFHSGFNNTKYQI